MCLIEIHACLTYCTDVQPPMICLSYTGTMAQMKRLSKTYDMKVLELNNSLVRTVQVYMVITIGSMHCRQISQEEKNEI